MCGFIKIGIFIKRYLIKLELFWRKVQKSASKIANCIISLCKMLFFYRYRAQIPTSPSQNGKSSSTKAPLFSFESFSLISFGRLSQSQKAFLPIFDNDSGITTEVNILQPSKA